jgi:hypothetical protein
MPSSGAPLDPPSANAAAADSRRHVPVDVHPIGAPGLSAAMSELPTIERHADLADVAFVASYCAQQ